MKLTREEWLRDGELRAERQNHWFWNVFLPQVRAERLKEAKIIKPENEYDEQWDYDVCGSRRNHEFGE